MAKEADDAWLPCQFWKITQIDIKPMGAMIATFALVIAVCFVPQPVAAAINNDQSLAGGLGAGGVVGPGSSSQLTPPYSCFKGGDDPKPKQLQPAIGLLMPNHHHVHQIMTRMFAMFVREKLNYENVSLISYKFEGNMSSSKFEESKLKNTLNLIQYHPLYTDLIKINLAVWMPTNGHSWIPETINAMGSSITPARYAWFVPRFESNIFSSSVDIVPFETFQYPRNASYGNYLFADDILKDLQNNASRQFKSPLCAAYACVTLIAESYYDTGFVERQIIETGSFVNVLWMNDKFEQTVTWLYDHYAKNYEFQNRKYIVLHWSPSSLMDLELKYLQVTMPRCEISPAMQASHCKYELAPVIKYASKSVAHKRHRSLFTALRKFYISDAGLLQLQRVLAQHIGKPLFDKDYNDIACNWLKENEGVYKGWLGTSNEKITLTIGGIFPITNQKSRGHQNLVKAAELAVRAINRNDSVLSNYQLIMGVNDGQCRSDLVMKAFIHYFDQSDLLGVLGPACSETVEPIAGISQHMNMAVISYSAEGATFADRETYPYFFRTIGSNRQYEDVYISLMKSMHWRRVGALTEDGNKYTEYISHMETNMKQRNLELMMNKKFLKSVKPEEMNKHLLDFKQKHTKIIIADINDKFAIMAMCEAYKLQMTAYDGYVWFLPSWIPKDWSVANSNYTTDFCNRTSLQKAFDGHFSIMHAPYGESNSIMQEGITVGEWLQKNIGIDSSKYTGFAYDAVWAYALAADRILRGRVINDFRDIEVVKDLVKIIWKTDFNGLSGRIRFGKGGSRITELNVVQWQRTHFVDVGKFIPHINGSGQAMSTVGGKLTLNESAIRWLGAEKPPGDGTYDCSFTKLAKLMAKDCETATAILLYIFCLIVVIMVSMLSFFFWKRQYDSKMKKSKQIMKNYGIDLLSTSRNKMNCLDKWEIPKEKVLVNRRLGEGAFGTVYGGEAFLSDTGDRTAVAVKTLKVGASMEDRIDFLAEAEAMKRLDHENVIKLIGICTQSEPLYTIMEFMLYGDLRTYLLARRYMVYEKNMEDSEISPRRLTRYALDIAQGLQYLAKQKYVHRDIACRNCLVSSHRVVKLADFGFARCIFDTNYYRVIREGMLPVRWMAPESLEMGLFTPASDIFAFGVVLYEIITFGSFPYQGLSNLQVLELVRNGKTLEIPAGAKPQLEGLMRTCWSSDAKKRPTAGEVIEHIGQFTTLLTPCLNMPSAASEIFADENNDDLDLLSNIRKCSPPIDILMAVGEYNTFDRNSEFGDKLELSSTRLNLATNNIDLLLPRKNTTNPFPQITPDGYSVMAPLLMHQMSQNSDSSQAHLLKKSSEETL